MTTTIKLPVKEVSDSSSWGVLHLCHIHILEMNGESYRFKESLRRREVMA